MPAVGSRLSDDFDVQAHRGGAGLRPENTLAAFGNALALGVTTLECDVHLTRDGVPVVNHDRQVQGSRNRDTGPATPGDPDFPYVGGYLSRLTWAQVRTIDVGSDVRLEHPGQRPSPGARMPRLEEVFALLVERGADTVGVNLETKFDVLAPEETAPRERFVEVVADTVRSAGMLERTSVQSFDWGALRLMRDHEPALRLNALTSGHYLQEGMPGASPWLGGLDIDDFSGNLVAAAATLGFDAVSPVHGSPFRSGVADPAYRPFVTASMVADAHGAGMRVLPYTVDDPATMHGLVELGVDGLITNYPDRLLKVLRAAGIPTPAQYPAGGALDR